MRIGLVGSGAIGCAVAARVAHAGHEVFLVVRSPERRAALIEQGLTCIEPENHIHARPHIVAALPDQPLDVLILAVKAQDLVPAVADVPPGAVNAETSVLPLVNGVPWWLGFKQGSAASPIRAVDPDGAMIRRFQPGQIVGTVVYTAATTVDACSVRVMRQQEILFGPIAGTTPARLAAVADVLNTAGITARQTDRIRDELWTKLALNLATNPLSVVTEASLGLLGSDAGLAPLVSAMLDEVSTLAGHYDARTTLSLDQMIERCRMGGAFRTSMLEDYAHGRPLELGSIAEAVLELAADVGLDLPVCRSVSALAKYRGASVRPSARAIAA